MAAQLIHLRFPPRPLHSLSVPLRCVGRDYKVYTRLAARRLTAKWFPKLRYALEEECVSCDVENSRGSNMLDGAINSSNGMDDFEGQLKNLFLEVRAKLEMGNKDDAVSLLQANFEAVKEQINAGFKGIEQAAILDTLALGYMGMGDFRTVEHLLNMLKDIVGDLHDDIPLMDSILMHMGSMYNTMGKFEEAICLYARGLKIIEQEFGTCSPFLITPLMGMAKALGFTGRVSEAVTLYHRAIDILENARGTENEDLVIPLSALGNLFISEGKATNAVDCFKRILDIYRKIYGEDNGKVGMAMCSLSHAVCAKGNINEAISMYKSGLQVIKDAKYMAVNDDLLEKMRTDLAELLHVAGREQEGRELLEECLLISEKHKGLEHPSSVTHLLNIAMSHSRSKNFAEAERLLRTCWHIMLRTVGPKDQSITVPMLHLAVTLYNLDRDEEAERLTLEVVRIREDAFGKESLPVGEALDCLVSIQMRLGNDDNDVLATLKRVLNIQEKEMGFESEEALTTLKKVVFYLDKMGKRDEKLPLQRRLSLLRRKYKQKVSV
ncbi:unnamed protein product [Musa acuminata subsp. malaccensis]|uniref:(wild Malaysian banana) hypothetical protein n=1 Tax=Musa acuminata subsp. malaccensis TaxID=214687 RepID=A0A804I3Q0_MUSAM|nr:PREDICTED: uncharacterized protein LOC103975477 isoform X2 [Musa acuminata subsp. malaccensis]CAG1862297.1 unnamed protein product [Musa acuminata subsp. malaccensis]